MVSGMIAWARLPWLLPLIWLSSRAPAQIDAGGVSQAAVLAPPPKIAFPDWHEVDETDSSIIYQESFPSAIISPYPENNTVSLKVFIPTERQSGVPVVLITHYWGAKDLRAEEALAEDLNDRGIGAAIMTLPYHLSRTPAGHGSGDLAIVPDPERLVLTMLQCEQDVRRSLDFLDSRPEVKHGGYGLVGTSLGAIVSGLVYAIEPRVHDAAFLVGGVDLARILWTSSRVVQVREQLKKAGWTEDRIRKVLAPVEPLSYLPRQTPCSTFVIYGRFDTVVPNECTRELIEHLASPDVLELETGHYGGLFVKSKVLTTVSTFFADKLSGRPFIPPSRLVAPTIRIGALLATPNDVDLTGGLDLIHFDRLSKNFGSLLATPRGLRLFVGHQIGPGFSFGVVGSGRGIGVGFLWSTVL
jgi:dienelactone hydrolase